MQDREPFMVELKIAAIKMTSGAVRRLLARLVRHSSEGGRLWLEWAGVDVARLG